jgi:hypothetical protein
MALKFLLSIGTILLIFSLLNWALHLDLISNTTTLCTGITSLCIIGIAILVKRNK